MASNFAHRQELPNRHCRIFGLDLKWIMARGALHAGPAQFSELVYRSVVAINPTVDSYSIHEPLHSAG